MWRCLWAGGEDWRARSAWPDPSVHTAVCRRHPLRWQLSAVPRSDLESVEQTRAAWSSGRQGRCFRGADGPEGFAALLRRAALLNRCIASRLELLLDLLHRRRELVAQPAGVVGEGPVVVGEGGIQLTGLHRHAERLQQGFELLLQLLLPCLERGDRIQQGIDRLRCRCGWRSSDGGGGHDVRHSNKQARKTQPGAQISVLALL